MTRVEDLPRCAKCGGPLLPLVVCDTCGGASVLRDRTEVSPTLECPECGAPNPTQLMCDQCHTRQTFEAVAEAPRPRRPAACPMCATFLSPTAETCPTCGYRIAPAPAPLRRTKVRHARRIRGDYDEREAQEIRRIPGVTPERAQVLLDAGYNAIWKVKRASEAELAALPGIGPEATREILEGLRFVLVFPRQRSKESILDEEYECPLCGSVTSAFAPSCVDCRAAFDDEEMDEQTRLGLLRDGDRGVLAFYDLRLMEDPEDEDLWYARGLLLEAMGQSAEARQALERAATLAPGKRRIALARMRLLAKSGMEPRAAEELRSTVREVVATAALDQEIEEFQRSVVGELPTCRVCNEPLPPGAVRCPACATPVGAQVGPAGPEPAAPPASELAELDTLLQDLEKGVREEVSREIASEPPPAPEPAPPPGPEPAPVPAAPERAPTRRERAAPHESTPGGFRSRSFFQRARRAEILGAVNGAVNGVVRARGMINGFINGRGRINGFINGRGYVNGSGLTEVRLPRARHRRVTGILGAGILIALILLGSLVLPPPGPSAPIVIDGAFQDWAPVPSLDAATSALDPDVELARFASLLDRDDLYLHASVVGTMFGDGVGYDGVYFLIDADGDPSTGYRFAAQGADVVVETYGGNATLASARAYAFPADAELNWSQRQTGPTVAAAASAQGVELRLPILDLAFFDPEAFRIAVYADNFEGTRSRSEVSLSRLPGAIRVEAVPLATVLGAGPTDLLEVRVAAIGDLPAGETWTVSNFQLTATPGVATSLSAESVNLTRGQETASLRVSVQAPGFFSGDAVEVELLGATGPRPVSVIGEPVRAYVGAPSLAKKVDGLFADWSIDAAVDSDPARINNSDVDIARYGAATDGATAWFYVEVNGTIFAGGLPQRAIRIPPGPPGGGGGPANETPEPRRTAEDVLRVYVDVNASDSSGFPFEGIYADRLVEIKGQGGRITSRELFAWSGSWTKEVGPIVPVAKGSRAIEGSLEIPPTLAEVRMVIAATDWSGIGDITLPVTATSAPPPAPPQSSYPIVINAPEFETIAVPIAGIVLLAIFASRRRRRSP